jgi:hypothetical protein
VKRGVLWHGTHVKQPLYGSLHVLSFDIRKKWMCCRLMPLLLLFHLPNLCSTMLARRPRNYADAKGCRTRGGSTACDKNAIGIFEHREAALPKRSG